MLTRSLRIAFLATVCALLGGCPKEDPKPEEKAEREGTSDDDEGEAPAVEGSAVEASATEAAASETGPTVTIAAGTFRAGSRCFDVPRITPQELEHEEISMGETTMDVYPYPNEPGKPALVGVTWQKAKELCEERGKRLCTELEWERACKGPKSTTYMWGDLYGKNQKDCEGQKDLLTGQRPACKSDYGVIDLVGAGMEWTASDWERGTPTGEKVVRGARDAVVSWLSARCTHSRKRDPSQSHADVGFRCCSGPESAAKVVMRPKRDQTVERANAIEPQFEMSLMKSMPRDHRGISGIELSFDEVYRWHPVAGEEMVIGRWRGKPDDGAAFHELAVFKICGARAWLAARMRGPVATIGKPEEGADPRKLSFDVKTGDEAGVVKLKYWHGTVKLEEPAWVKTGNQLAVDEAKPVVRRRIPKLIKKK